MYAVFQSGGKQHRVSEGQTVRLEKLELEDDQSKHLEKVWLFTIVTLSVVLT